MSVGTLTFEEYWVAFVRAHASPSLRRLSFASMSAAIGSATAFLLTRRSVFLVLSPFVAFVPPWLARKLEAVRPRRIEYYDAWYHIALALSQQQETVKARQALQGIMRLSPTVGSPEMKAKFEALLARLSKK